MATIKEIAEAVGVSNATVSRVLSYDSGISVSAETRQAIFATAEKLGYKRKVIYPSIENAALFYFVEHEDELEDELYQSIKAELIRQAAETNISLTIYDDRDSIEDLPDDIGAFVGMGWLDRGEINRLYEKCHYGVFIGTSPDEKLFDSVRPNMESFVTQMVDFFIEKGHREIGFVGGWDRNIDTGKPSMDIREWSFRQSMMYYECLREEYIYLAEKYTVEEGYRIGKKILKKKKRPTALCVASDTLAIGILQALNEKQVSIPGEMAIFSINDSHTSRYVSPPLSTMHIDVEVLCETALELLRNKYLSKTEITKTVFVNGLPTFRKSC